VFTLFYADLAIFLTPVHPINMLLSCLLLIENNKRENKERKKQPEESKNANMELGVRVTNIGSFIGLVFYTE